MSEPFIAEVRIFAGNFAPRSWAFCDGQLLPISQNTALFALVGTTYGGDGETTLALPDLQNRAPMHPGRGPGLTQRRLGQRGGASTVALTEAQMPAHSHVWRTAEDPADLQAPGPNRSMTRSSIDAYAAAPSNTDLAPEMLRPQGGGQAHNNRSPFIGLHFIIALQGLFPSES